jgi:enediyne biosynthesis protein E4
LRTRRQRLIWRTVFIAPLSGALAAAFVVLQPAPAQYVPGEELTGLTDDLSRDLPSDYPRAKFVDATRETGIHFRHFHGSRSHQLPEDMGSGAAWADCDGDGDFDLYIVNTAGALTLTPAQLAASPAHSALFRNDGGTFAEISAAAGVDQRTIGQAAAWADYDGDGQLDLFTTAYGRNALFHNEGDATFLPTPFDQQEGFWAGATWGDYDADGDLDLYVTGYVQYRLDPAHLTAKSRQYDTAIPASLNPSTYAPERNLLYRNDGGSSTGWSFVEVANTAGVQNATGRSLSAAFCDFDEDGLPELYVANDLSDNALYHNLGNGTFADISHSAHVADYRGAMGLASGDWDNDGDMDLFVTHWIAQENAFYSSMHADYREAGLDPTATSLRFMDLADRFGLGQIALDYVGWGTAFFDYDNDGRQDLIIANGSTFEQGDDPSRLVAMRPQLFWNKSDEEGFFEVGIASGEVFTRPQVGRGLAIADYDDDGDEDALIVANGEEATLLRNDSDKVHHWFKVRTRDAAGVEIRLWFGGQLRIRQLGSSPSYYSQHAVGEAHFGLGAHTQIDSLEITWSNGQQRRYDSIQVDQTLLVEKP